MCVKHTVTTEHRKRETICQPKHVTNHENFTCKYLQNGTNATKNKENGQHKYEPTQYKTIVNDNTKANQWRKKNS